MTEKQKRTPMRRKDGGAMTGQINVHRSLEQSSEEIGSASSTDEVTLDNPGDHLDAEATGNIGMTLPTDVRFEMLRIDAGGRLPCTSADFKSGKAHSELFGLLRARFREEHQKGKTGL